MTQSSLSLLLEGKVFLIERRGFKEISREELDGHSVLGCVLEALDSRVTAYKPIKKHKKR